MDLIEPKSIGVEVRVKVRGTQVRGTQVRGTQEASSPSFSHDCAPPRYSARVGVAGRVRVRVRV